MHVSPHSSITDGLLNLIVFGDANFFQVVHIMNLIKKAKHLSHPITKVEEKSTGYQFLPKQKNDEIFIETDGELCGKLPATFKIVPNAIHFVIPKNSIEKN